MDVERGTFLKECPDVDVVPVVYAMPKLLPEAVI